MEGLLTYNGFGFISVSPDRVRVTITAVNGEFEISRTVEKDLDADKDITKESTYAIGIFIDPGKPTRMTVRELSEPAGKNLLAHPTVQEAIKNTIDLVRTSAQFA